ncbi:HAMP domain-containing sensor histidine kinase [Paenibacillus caui]|uniref:HAMP domain-containing sensor histidine kinase n=1 Tax=Paenibacillus caui TaxID=2873927 RepID=UPI001CA92A3A|nr:HAMP domain-containing sensor histidine kinase [Paenibacillus caui]
MKLRVKLPLLFSFIVLGLALIIALYVRASVIESITSHIRQDFANKNAEIARRAGELYPDMDAVSRYLEKISEEENITVTLYRKDFTPAGSFNAAANDKSAVEAWDEVKDGQGNTVLLLKFNRSMNNRNVVLRMALTRTFTLLFVALALIFVVLTLYFNHFITKPIQRLNRRLGKIKGTPLPSKLTVSRRDEIGELYRHVNRMEERLIQANKEQIDMVAAIAHDIKTPLTSINGFLELLLTKDSVTEQDKKDYLQLISRKAKHLSELMAEFSRYTKDEVLLPSLDFGTVHVRELFESVAVEYEAELAGFDFTLIRHNGFKADDHILANEPMLRRVFANLISNAVRYASAPDLVVEMRGISKEGQAIFTIEDNGVGVPEEAIPRLFQRFFTVDQSRQSREGGTGLGLSSCQSIVNRHGGEIYASRSPLGGLKITFTIPLA